MVWYHSLRPYIPAATRRWDRIRAATTIQSYARRRLARRRYTRMRARSIYYMLRRNPGAFNRYAYRGRLMTTRRRFSRRLRGRRIRYG